MKYSIIRLSMTQNKKKMRGGGKPYKSFLKITFLKKYFFSMKFHYFLNFKNSLKIHNYKEI